MVAIRGFRHDTATALRGGRIACRTFRCILCCLSMTHRTVTFYFEGRPSRGVEGQPIAKALFMAGVRTLSYSVKYKRPRSIHCARGRCVMCHMSVNGVPGVPTCITPLEEGMRIEREDYRPHFGGVLTTAARLIPLPAGFYYRKFTKPAVLRNVFLGSLRRMAGVGRLPLDGDPAGPGAHNRSSTSPFPDGEYDVVVVGGGLAGMSAAASAADRGARVLLVDEYGFLGGHSVGYNRDGEIVSTRDRLIERITGVPLIHHHGNVTALGFYPPNTVLLGPGGSAGFERYTGRSDDPPPDPQGRGTARSLRTQMKRVRAAAFVFATGANDLIPLFENNDTPGIFGSRAIRLLLERDDFRPGRRAVVYGTGALMLDTAGFLLHHGISVEGLVDTHPVDLGADGLEQIRRIGRATITAAKGGEWLRSVEVTRELGNGRVERISLPSDLLCIALPGQAAYELPYQAGFDFSLSDADREEYRFMLPRSTHRTSGDDETITLVVVGEAAGQNDWREKIEKGTQAGILATRPGGRR